MSWKSWTFTFTKTFKSVLWHNTLYLWPHDPWPISCSPFQWSTSATLGQTLTALQTPRVWTAFVLTMNKCWPHSMLLTLPMVEVKTKERKEIKTLNLKAKTFNRKGWVYLHHELQISSMIITPHELKSFPSNYDICVHHRYQTNAKQQWIFLSS